MKLTKSTTVAIVISLLTLFLVVSLLYSVGTGLKQAPDINVIDLKGNSISLKSLRGNPVLITFWASNCGI